MTTRREVTRRQRHVLWAARSFILATTTVIAAQLGEPTQQVRRDLRDLERLGYVIADRSNPSVTYWRSNPRVLGDPPRA